VIALLQRFTCSPCDDEAVVPAPKFSALANVAAKFDIISGFLAVSKKTSGARLAWGKAPSRLVKGCPKRFVFEKLNQSVAQRSVLR